MAARLEHVAIIMDGNGRWAQQKNKPRTFGHIKGARVAKKIITHAGNSGLKNLTLYAFSTENWLRPQTEVSFLMRLMKRYLQKETTTLIKENVRFSVIGEVEKLPKDIQLAIHTTKKLTEKNTGLHLTFAMSYGSRQEILMAVKDIAEKFKNGEVDKNQITESFFNSHLMTSGTPDPDLIIRTSGESRLSNFMMWQASYSELYFSATPWPDFTTKHFDHCCQNYFQRERRFGGTKIKNEESFI